MTRDIQGFGDHVPLKRDIFSASGGEAFVDCPALKINVSYSAADKPDLMYVYTP